MDLYNVAFTKKQIHHPIGDGSSTDQSEALWESVVANYPLSDELASTQVNILLAESTWNVAGDLWSALAGIGDQFQYSNKATRTDSACQNTFNSTTDTNDQGYPASCDAPRQAANSTTQYPEIWPDFINVNPLHYMSFSMQSTHSHQSSAPSSLAHSFSKQLALCPSCGKIASRATKRSNRASNLRRHIRERHGLTGIKIPLCPEPGCGKRFGRPSNVLRHLRKVHGLQPSQE